MTDNRSRLRKAIAVMRELRRLTTLRPMSEMTPADEPALVWFVGDAAAGAPECHGVIGFDSPVVVRTHLHAAFRWTPLPKVRP